MLNRGKRNVESGIRAVAEAARGCGSTVEAACGARAAEEGGRWEVDGGDDLHKSQTMEDR